MKSFLSGGLALAVTLSAVPVFADQFTLMDVTFTFTKEQADTSMPSPSHYYVYEDALVPGQPADWTTPVDYRSGKLHLRTEVIDKPAGGEITQWSVCYIPHVGIGAGYGCTNSGTYTEEGVYEIDESMTSWWQNDQLDWTHGIKEMHLVIKDSDPANGQAHQREDSEKFFPTTVRMTLVQVSAGATYDESLVTELSRPASSGGAQAGAGGDTAVGAGGAVGSGGAPAENGGSPATGGSADSSKGGDKSEAGSGGCALAPRPKVGTFAWGIALFGLFLLRRRRAV